MQTKAPLIDPTMLQHLFGVSGALRSSLSEARILGTHGGWCVGVIVAGEIEMVGRVRDGKPRTWRSLDACFDFIRDRLAITTFTVDGQQFVAETPKKRLDASARMKSLHQALKQQEKS